MADTELDFTSMKVADLKKELKSRGLAISGNKTELIERLQLAVMTSAEETEAPPAATETPTQVKPAQKTPVKREAPPASAAKPATDAPPAKKALIQSPKAEETKEKAEELAVADSSNDLNKAKARAERFGITSDQAKKALRAERFGLPANNSSKPAKIGEAPSVDMETLKKRAERFGASSSQAMKKAELDEKIKKRQERFGVVSNTKGPKVSVNPGVNSVVQTEAMKKRAERFGIKA